ncbi:MAG: type II toxin-antitoxin system VapC family toxin [Promethearchaeota archaeon]
MKACLDTNIFLAVKNKELHYEYCEKILNFIEDKKINGVMSTIVLAEVLVGFYQIGENKEANRFSSSALLNYDIIPVNHDIAQKAAQIRAQYNIKLPDAIISASTIISGSDFFITNNKTLLKKLKICEITPREFVEKYIENKKEKE